MITINDIAKRLGVSKSTISRYLNGGSVSEQTRLKIDEIIKETGYTPNAFARSLKAKKTHIIGIIVPRLDSEASVQMLKGIEGILHLQKYQTLITNTYQDLEKEYEAISTFYRQKVDGIILMSSHLTPRHVEQVAQMEIPFISLGQSIKGINSIIFDDYYAGQLVAQHLIHHHHRRILYLGVTATDESVGVRRYLGFKETLDKANISHDFLEVSFNPLKAAQKFEKEVSIQSYTAIACATDNIAVSILNSLYHQAIKVNDDISLIGFGGHQLTEFVNPALDTIDYDYEEAGVRAAKQMLLLINGIDIDEKEVMSVALHAKQSVKRL